MATTTHPLIELRVGLLVRADRIIRIELDNDDREYGCAVWTLDRTGPFLLPAAAYDAIYAGYYAIAKGAQK